jgi:hypothetical protein
MRQRNWSKLRRYFIERRCLIDRGHISTKEELRAIAAKAVAEFSCTIPPPQPSARFRRSGAR